MNVEITFRNHTFRVGLHVTFRLNDKAHSIQFSIQAGQLKVSVKPSR